VALVAPAGFGKSALIADWVRVDARPVAWLNTLERDNDPAALLGLLTHAVGRLADMTTGLATELDADGVSAWAGTPHLLGAAIRRCDHPFIVVLDNAEKLRNPSAIDAAVAFAEHLPPGSQLVVSARSTSGWPIARLVAAGEAVMFGTLDLAFDLEEARQPLAGGGTVWSNAVAEQILARTEGWPVAMYLEAIAHRREARTPARAAAAVTGPLRLVSEYVKTEVLAGQSEADAEFLLRTSHLERLTAGLCDAVLERSGSADALHRIEETCLFLTRLGGGEWYRLQPMLREVLREELQGDPDLLARQNGLAAAWFEAEGLMEEALVCAFAARDAGRLARVLPIAIRRAFSSGRTETVRSWLAEAERSAGIATNPDLAATAAIAYAILDDAGRAERCSDVATRAAGSTRDPILAGRAAVARALLCREGVERMEADARLAVDQLPAAAPDAPLARLLLGIAEVLEGESDRADRTLADAAEAALAADVAGWEACTALIFRAHLAEARGDRDRAADLTRRARAVMLDANLGGQAVSVLVHAMSARMAVHHGATAQARSDLASAERVRGSLTHALPWAALRARLDMAAALLSLSDVAGARLQLIEIREIEWMRPGLGALEAEGSGLAQQVDAIRETNLSAFMLTMAELRLLPLLATHLTFREIGDRLYLSTSTIKTEAKSIYRKLNVASRSGAVRCAAEIGLLDPWIRLEPTIVPVGGDE
jgi:LuxR family maltose regulon positive regulatory protein